MPDSATIDADVPCAEYFAGTQALMRSGDGPGGDEANARTTSRFRDLVRWL